MSGAPGADGGGLEKLRRAPSRNNPMVSHTSIESTQQVLRPRLTPPSQALLLIKNGVLHPLRVAHLLLTSY